VIRKSKPISVPLRISHYTTLEGMKGIVESGCLWASNAAFLNDKVELSHALAASKQVIRKLSSDKAFEKWELALKEIFEKLTTSGIPDTYVACFCKSDDNLSQWRGYGGTTQGISLTFSRSKLAARLKKDGAEFHQVLYSHYSTAAKLKSALKNEVSDLADLDKIIGGSDEEENNIDLYRRVSALLPRFKHLGFKDEKEWRFIIQREIAERDLCFRVSNNKIVPYIKVGSGGEANSPLPLTSVRIGPGADQELTMQSVRTFLSAKGYTDVDVDASEIPFRP
jgi:hypothetical protein